MSTKNLLLENLFFSQDFHFFLASWDQRIGYNTTNSKEFTHFSERMAKLAKRAK